MVLAIAFYLPITLLAPIASVSATSAPYVAPPSIAPILTLPNYGASAISAIGYAGPLAQGGSRKPLPMASMTKIITTLVVLEKKPLTLGQSGPDISFTRLTRRLVRATRRATVTFTRSRSGPR